jgi:hypothetical protein
MNFNFLNYYNLNFQNLVNNLSKFWKFLNRCVFFLTKMSFIMHSNKFLNFFTFLNFKFKKVKKSIVKFITTKILKLQVYKNFSKFITKIFIIYKNFFVINNLKLLFFFYKPFRFINYYFLYYGLMKTLVKKKKCYKGLSKFRAKGMTTLLRRKGKMALRSFKFKFNHILLNYRFNPSILYFLKKFLPKIGKFLYFFFRKNFTFI